MARVADDDRGKQPGKPRVYSITIQTLKKTKVGWKVEYDHTITKEHGQNPMESEEDG